MLRNWKLADVDDKDENNTNTERQRKGQGSSNYRPITCLSLVWKLLIGVISEEVYGFLDANLLLPQE